MKISRRRRRSRRWPKELVDYLLFDQEARISSPVRGTSGFEEKFAAEGPFDKQGRSLRQFDLSRRMDAVSVASYMDLLAGVPDALPAQAKRCGLPTPVWRVLSGQEAVAPFEAEDRRAIVEILPRHERFAGVFLRASCFGLGGDRSSPGWVALRRDRVRRRGSRWLRWSSTALFGPVWIATAHLAFDCLTMAAAGWVAGRSNRPHSIPTALLFAATLCFWDLGELNVPWLLRLAWNAVHDSRFLDSSPHQRGRRTHYCSAACSPALTMLEPGAC